MYVWILQLIESQMKNLESKFSRREYEFRAAVDDIRASAKMERMRMQALHEQVTKINIQYIVMTLSSSSEFDILVILI
jgi:hypothetical protein